MPPRKKAKLGAKVDDSFGECMSILKFFNSKPDTEAFREPVDWKFLELLDYPKIIKTPMDLGTVWANVEAAKYENPEQFALDVRMVWGNAMTYNRPGSEIYKVAEKYLKIFDKKWSKFSKAEPKRKGKAATPDVGKADRIKFSQLVNQLNSDELEQLVKKIESECPEALSEELDDELEIEINNINPETLASLNSFCNKCIKRK